MGMLCTLLAIVKAATIMEIIIAPNIAYYKI
jgi:hypothetical protein